MIARFVLLLLACAAIPYAAANSSTNNVAAPPAKQFNALIEKTVADFVRAETAALPGETTVTISPLDASSNLAACPAPQAFLPPGGRLWGNAVVGVRCFDKNAWTIYVQVQVKVMTDVVISARPLSKNQRLTLEDLSVQKMDMAQLPAGSITDAAQAVGKTVQHALSAKQPLRLEWLRSPLLIQQGQNVELFTSGTGFRVSMEGQALSHAAEGQVVAVRTAAGRTINGVARSATAVEVMP